MNKNNILFRAAQYATGDMIPEGFPDYYIQRFRINNQAYTWNIIRNGNVIAASKIYDKVEITNQALKICKELDIRFNKSIIGDRRQPIIMKGVHRMTWKEFKDKVEEAGITDEMKISWVDWVEGTEIQAHPPTEDEDAYIG